MSLRRYVNLVTGNGHQGMYSLRRLNSHNFFYSANEAAAKARDLPRLRRVPPHGLAQKRKKKKQAAAVSVQEPEGTIRPPRPIFNVRPTKCPVTNGDQPELHSFPLSGTKIFFADSGKRTILYDTEARCLITTPYLHERKDFPVSLSVPSPGPEGEQDQDGGSLYILETMLDPRNPTPFEALICRLREDEHFTAAQKTWHCDALPRPPFFHDHFDPYKLVLSYAVVGAVICVSVTKIGTFCFDTVGRTWSLAGDWLMPFSGKAEYVPELRLWFGVSADNHQLPCAADLSPVPGGHAPKKRYVWGDPHLPVDWLPDLYNPASIVSLGSGRFCIINYFQDMEGMDELSDSDGSPVVVFSGLEVLAGNGKGSTSIDSNKENYSDKGNIKESSGDNDIQIYSGKSKGNGLRMIKHKSRLCRNTDSHCIESVL